MIQISEVVKFSKKSPIRESLLPQNFSKSPIRKSLFLQNAKVSYHESNQNELFTCRKMLWWFSWCELGKC